MSDIFLEEVHDFVKNGTIEIYLGQLLELARTETNFEKGTVYSLEVFREHLKYFKHVGSLDCVNSTITRCVEYGLMEQLVLLLERITKEVWFEAVDKRLLLRKASIQVYLKAKEYGFIDLEFEKRIVLIQNIWRSRKLPSKNVDYSGPTYEEYCAGNYDPKDRYWGYRQTLYFLKWHRTQRFRMLKTIISDKWGKDCRFQAYIDYLEHEEFMD